MECKPTPDNSARCTRRPFVRPPWCRERLKTIITGPSMTQQADFDQTDVNAIVARFARTGHLPDNPRQPQYGDVTALQGDLTELIESSRQKIRTAEEFARNWTPAPPVPEPTPPEPTPVPPAAPNS